MEEEIFEIGRTGEEELIETETVNDSSSDYYECRDIDSRSPAGSPCKSLEKCTLQDFEVIPVKLPEFETNDKVQEKLKVLKLSDYKMLPECERNVFQDIVCPKDLEVEQKTSLVKWLESEPGSSGDEDTMHLQEDMDTSKEIEVYDDNESNVKKSELFQRLNKVTETISRLRHSLDIERDMLAIEKDELLRIQEVHLSPTMFAEDGDGLEGQMSRYEKALADVQAEARKNRDRRTRASVYMKKVQQVEKMCYDEIDRLNETSNRMDRLRRDVGGVLSLYSPRGVTEEDQEDRISVSYRQPSLQTPLLDNSDPGTASAHSCYPSSCPPSDVTSVSDSMSSMYISRDLRPNRIAPDAQGYAFQLLPPRLAPEIPGYSSTNASRGVLSVSAAGDVTVTRDTRNDKMATDMKLGAGEHLTHKDNMADDFKMKICQLQAQLHKDFPAQIDIKHLLNRSASSFN